MGASGKYSTRRRVDGALTHLLFLCGRIISVIFVYLVVMDSQCDAFSQVSIIGDAFKVRISNVMVCDNLPFKCVGVVVQRARRETF